MQDAGVEIVVDAATLSVVGITEVFSKLPGILSGMAAAKSFLKNARPDLLILIDFPDFNLRIAAVAKKWNIPVLFYISPQIWAWRSGRVTKIGRLVDHIAVILPFEASFYRKHHIPVTFVGHPLLDEFRDAPCLLRRLPCRIPRRSSACFPDPGKAKFSVSCRSCFRQPEFCPRKWISDLWFPWLPAPPMTP